MVDMANWTDEPKLYFHFLTPNGSAASLPMTRKLLSFPREFVGVPGTEIRKVNGETRWIVPGFKCISCGLVFFAPTKDGLKHGCMNDGGIVSARA
jgi:hypothetical protein